MDFWKCTEFLGFWKYTEFFDFRKHTESCDFLEMYVIFEFLEMYRIFGFLEFFIDFRGVQFFSIWKKMNVWNSVRKKKWAEEVQFLLIDTHCVWNKQKKSHSTLRATFPFPKKVIKNDAFWKVFENLNFTVKQCYQIGHF